MKKLQIFCRQVRERSKENQRAISALHDSELHSQVVSVLRQELDSLVRVIYLLSIADGENRERLVTASVEGEQWCHPGGRRRITDKEMVDLAQSLHGWTQSVYRFGCAFIHLSRFHDYRNRDPFTALEPEEQKSIIKHMRYYHGGPQTGTPTFADLVPFFPSVFTKVADNLEYYLENLEKGGGLEDEERTVAGGTER